VSDMTTAHTVTIEGVEFTLSAGQVNISGIQLSLEGFINAAVQLKRLDLATQPLPATFDPLSAIFGKVTRSAQS
jgi:hypothetical protein